MHTKRFTLAVAKILMLVGMLLAPLQMQAQGGCAPWEKMCNGFCMPANVTCCPPDQRACHGSCVSQGVLCCENTSDIICNGTCYPAGTICLLEPPPGVPTVIPAGQNPWQVYVNQGLWNWAIGIGIGLAVLNGTIAGFQIMTGQNDLGKERFKWSLVGLIMLLFAGVILNFLNPNAFIAG